MEQIKQLARVRAPSMYVFIEKLCSHHRDREKQTYLPVFCVLTQQTHAHISVFFSQVKHLCSSAANAYISYTWSIFPLRTRFEENSSQSSSHVKLGAFLHGFCKKLEMFCFKMYTCCIFPFILWCHVCLFI